MSMNKYLFNDAALLNEWNYEKNIGINPLTVAWSSNKKVWWKCTKGHEWQAYIANRTLHKSGCPICSGRQILSGFNDLATLNPTLAEEWNYTKNSSDIHPPNISVHSHKRVWWVCRKCQYEWITSVHSRSCGSSCPVCSIQKGVRKRNEQKIIKTGSLRHNSPSLASEWNYDRNAKLTPDDVTKHSNQSVWWKCPICGFEWKAVISSRASGIGCPQCANRYGTSFPEQAIFFYIKRQYPDAINRHQGDNTENMEIDIFIPSLMTAIEYDGIHWHTGGNTRNKEEIKYAMCKRKGIHLIRVSEDDKRNSDFCDELLFSRYRKITDIEELSATVCEVLQRLKVFSSCNIAADEADIRRGYYTNLKARSLLANAPRLADEWNNEKNNGLTPDMFSISSGIKVWWKCKDGHEWQASIANRLKERGCPFCANKRVLSGYNDLATTHPILVLEWNYERNGSIVPTLLTAGSNKTVWWKCKEGHEWQTSPISRQTNGCPVCAGQKVLAGFNDFASQQPSLMKEWNYEKNPTLQPYMVSKNSGKKAWWKCKKGHEWMATISSRVKGNGCPICANKVILQGYNDLASTHPELLMEWDYERNTLMSPTSVTGGSNKKIWWICNKGHHWQAFIFNRTKGHGCPYCSGRVGNFIMNIDTGEVFHSFSEASRKFSISISSISDCCKGKQKTAGGYHWKNCSNEDIKQ